MENNNSNKKKRLEGIDYENHVKKVMQQSNPSTKDYEQLDYDDRDRWVAKHRPNINFGGIGE